MFLMALSEPKNRRPDKAIHPLPNILAFHKLSSSITFGISNYTPQRFQRLLAALLRAGLRHQALSDALSTADLRTFAVTFDDGYQHLREVLPHF